jgi:hypothetical protein
MRPFSRRLPKQTSGVGSGTPHVTVHALCLRRSLTQGLCFRLGTYVLASGVRRQLDCYNLILKQGFRTAWACCRVIQAEAAFPRVRRGWHRRLVGRKQTPCILELQGEFEEMQRDGDRCREQSRVLKKA